MCIVTYVPYSSGFIFTSNRDENPNRPTKIPTYHYKNGTVQVYPKDEVAGGSWFGIHLNHNITASLLNAQPKHFPKKNKSRGKFLIECLTSVRGNHLTNPVEPNKLIDLPPFELIRVDFDSFPVEIRKYYWNGKELKNLEVDASKPHLWSSLSLYGKKKERQYQEIFRKWLNDVETVNQKKIMQLHHRTFAQSLHSDNFFQHQRKFEIKTVSISSLEVNRGNYIRSLVYHEIDSGRFVSRKFC